MIPADLGGYGLREINLYPYLTWIFYGVLLFLSPYWMRSEKRLFTLFLITLVFETAFLIDAGFFVRPAYIVGIIFLVRTLVHGVTFPRRYSLLLALFVFFGVVGIFLNADLIGAAISGETRATFLRPVIQLSQLVTMMLIAIAVFTVIKKRGYFVHTIRVFHWISVAVAIAAVYELLAIYFNLPYINLNNMVPHYWYPRFGAAAAPIFRARVTFIEPIELNNFQIFGITCSLVYRFIAHIPWRRYAPLLFLQVVVLIGGFSRSTIMVVFALVPILLFFYPRKARSAAGFLFNKFAPLVVALPLIFIIYFVFTLTPQRVESFGTVGRIAFERFAFMRHEELGITVLGRPTAVKEVRELSDDGRLPFGVGIGNEANWRGGVWGTASIYNQVIIASGVAGISIFLLFIGSIFLDLFRNYRRKTAGALYQRVQWIFFIGLLGIMGQRLAFSGLFTDTYLWVAFALCIYLGQTTTIVKRGVDSSYLNQQRAGTPV